MATCPSGHHSEHSDFCDVCGLPVAPEQIGSDKVVPLVPPTPTATIACPHCDATNVAEALFCEACGYDFTTGTVPEPAPAPQWPSLSPTPPSPTPSAQEPSAAPAAAAPPSLDRADGPAEQLAPAPAAETSPVPTAAADVVASPAQPAAKPVVEWVAELWIDPDWYAAQGSTDPMPSVGLPDIVGLGKPANLIGRVSHSKGIFPDIDCDLDTGCSRRHAMLSTDGTRWWIEDLNSANGTFVGSVGGPLPAMPIPQGRVELTEGQRIYVGAWTRIVIRRATPDEQEALAG